MRRLLVLLLLAASVASAQTTVTVSTTPLQSGLDRPGIVYGLLGPFGTAQVLKSLNYANGGYMPGGYWQSSWTCSSGGPTNTTTNWYNSTTDAQGYPANLLAGATFVAYNAATGASYGSGTVTASTSNTGATGISFTLSPAISSACNPSNNDVLIVKMTAANTLVTPQDILPFICGGATYNTTDTSPASTNTARSLAMPTGCTLQSGIDQPIGNDTNTNPTLAAQSSVYINFNGSYNLTYKAKCPTATCTIAYSFGRIGTTAFTSGTDTPTVNTTPGAGWTIFSHTFTASETGTQVNEAQLILTSTGAALVQDVDVIEGSTLAGNTTAFRDAFVRKLQAIHPGSFRYMDGSQWCSSVADETASDGNRRWCSMNEFLAFTGLQAPLGYADVLTLCNFIGSDCWLSVGQFNLPSDWTTLITWLSTTGWTSTFATTGHKIYLEEGNEAWNTSAVGGLWMGNGIVYGTVLGPNMAAAKAATGYNSSVIKLVGDGFVGNGQGCGIFGWMNISLSTAKATETGTLGLPDFEDNAPYMLDTLGSFTASGSNVSTTGAPFVDEFAEVANVDSVASATCSQGADSVLLNTANTKSQFGVGTAVYEVNYGTTAGIAVTQLQLDQVAASVGEALATEEHLLLMQRDSLVSGPINVFTIGGVFNGYTCNIGSGCVSGVVTPIWDTQRALACGPGQLSSCADPDRPDSIAAQIVNTAIGSNTILVSSVQSGTPTFSYAGGQSNGSSNTILANSAVPYVNCIPYTNGSGAWTDICFNNNLTTAETVILAGAGAPTGSVTQTIFPSSGNLITDHNENTYIGPSSISPVVGIPTATTTSGTSFSIPAASMMALTFNTGGTPTAATPTFSPVAGTYSGTQNVTVSCSTGPTACFSLTTTPATNGTTGCTTGTMVSGTVPISSTSTLHAICGGTGFLDGTPATAAYTITGGITAPTLTFGSIVTTANVVNF